MLILRAIIDQEENTGGRQALDQAIEEGLGFRINPVQVLTDQQHRLHLALAEQHPLQGIERALAALRRVEREERAVRRQHVQEREQRRHSVLEQRVERQDLAGDLGADGTHVIAVVHMTVALEQFDEWEIRRGLAVGDRGTLQDPPSLRLVGMDDLIDQARLAHAGFTHQRDHLAMPGLRLGQSLLHDHQLLVPPDKARQAPYHPRLEAAAQGACPDQFIDLHRRRQALDRHGAQGGDPHQPLRQPQRLGGQTNAPGRGQLLHPGRQVRGLAQGRVVHVQVVANGADHHFARVEAHADLHLHAVCPAHLGAIVADGLLHSQGGVTGPDGVIFMGDRRPEERHNAIAHDLVDRAFIAVHRRHHALDDGVEELTGLFRVAVGQQLHGALEIGKEHRYLLALAFQGTPGGEDFSAR